MTVDTHIRFRAVSKSYGSDALVVNNLDLEVERGEFLTLLGPSGSGKTTCLMMLAGFETPTSGSIEVDGRVVQNIPPHKRNIGIVFQNYALFPHMSVAKNLLFPLEVRGVAATERDSRIKTALELVQLEGLESRMPGQLSGGQQQRVAIARALVFEPDIVLMDEPLGALDRRLREEMQFEIRRIQRQIGITMVYVTHDQSEAMVLSDRIAVFYDGKIQQLAEPETLYEEPTEIFVSGFIGDNNHLLGTVTSMSNGVCFVDVQGYEIRAAAIGELTTDQHVAISIRPERIFISATPLDLSNSFEAHVDELVFLGDHLRIAVTACGTRDLIIKVPNIPGYEIVNPGADMYVGWATLSARALPNPIESSIPSLPVEEKS